MTCSNVSTALMRTTGWEDLSEVDFDGSGRFRPQSPRAREDAGVTMEARTGWGRVAVSDSKTALEVGGSCGGFNACGSANRRDFRSRFAVGDSLADAMACVSIATVSVEAVLCSERAGEKLDAADFNQVPAKPVYGGG